MNQHTSVMTDEILNCICVRPSGLYLDATFGGGGHSKAILESNGKIFAMDRDNYVLPILERFQADYDKKFAFSIDCFSHMEKNFNDSKFKNSKVDGIVMDLGMSNFQLKDESRGFSFSKEGNLDMRMGVGNKLSAADVLNSFSQNELEEIFRKYGEEPKASAIAKLVVKNRAIRKFRTTSQLSQICIQVWHSFRRRHPATLTFQALRIFVNRELEELEIGLIQAEKLLKEGGRVVVISFHSLEDRLVKTFFKRSQVLDAVKKVISPSESEISSNPRARSAKLRYATKG